MGRRQRRRSSNLGADPRGDTSAPAISTLSPSSSSPASPADSAFPYTADEKDYKPHSQRRKTRSVWQRWKQISLRRTWLNPLILVILILGSYAVNPSESNPLHKAIFLSYPIPPIRNGEPIMYGKGKDDFAFVAFYTVVLSFTREFFMQEVIRPFALRCGIRNRAKQSRFMEQVYTAMYFTVFAPLGIYVMSQGSLRNFNTTAMFEGFPHRQHEGVFKAYYLLQGSYWTQQAIVLLLQLEKPRKDFRELVLHHVVTLSLIFSSYRFHFAKMGIAVYITHDVSDFFLATSKTLNYLDSFIVGPYFGFFILVWIYMRHYINLTILYAILTEFETVGPFELNWETQQYKCRLSQFISFSLLATLQAVNLFWLFLILRIAKNYVVNSVAADERSDDEGDEGDEGDEEDDYIDKQAIFDEGPDVKDKVGLTTGGSAINSDNKPLIQLNGLLVNGDTEPEEATVRQRKGP